MERKQQSSVLALMSALLAIIVGCPFLGIPNAPDLLPVRLLDGNGVEISGPPGFCDRTGSTLTVTVRNDGEQDAGEFKVTVLFPASPEIIPWHLELGLDVGMEASKDFGIPPGCFDPDCSFEISVDNPAIIFEAGRESNNQVSGLCIG